MFLFPHLTKHHSSSPEEYQQTSDDSSHCAFGKYLICSIAPVAESSLAPTHRTIEEPLWFQCLLDSNLVGICDWIPSTCVHEANTVA